MPVAAAVGLGLAGSAYSAHQQRGAAKDAAAAQSAAADASIAEQQRQFDAMQALMKPYVDAGTGAIGSFQSLVGLKGAANQQNAVSAIENSSFFQAQLKQGENALLQTASATGGLRGGNTQGALATLAPQLLQSTYQNQLSNIGQLMSLGQNSAAMQGNAGMNMASNIGQQLVNQGQYAADARMARAAANTGLVNSISGLGGAMLTGGFGGF